MSVSANGSRNSAPPFQVGFEPRFCVNQVVDLTVGCSMGCIYCPFSDQAARRQGVLRPTVADASAIETLSPPTTVFLSGASDAFAPQAASHTHALLQRWLPRGTTVAIVTKGIIPLHSMDLLAKYPDQVEGVSVGVSSLDDRRNRVVEPGCPPASARLANIDSLAERNVRVGLRMDPLFPDLDDEPLALQNLIADASRRGATAVTASYVFTWGRYLRRLRREPLLASSCRLLTERAPMTGGMAFSVPLARKVRTYRQIAEIAALHDLRFNTCGCKDLRLAETAVVPVTCRNTKFLAEREGRPSACS